MAALITPAAVRLHVETDLADAALQRLVDQADQEIVQTAGAHSSTGTVTDLLIGGDRALFLLRTYALIASVTESRGTLDTVLATDDYRSWFGNRVIERLATGTNPQGEWGERVSVVYTPIDDDAVRIGATIELVRLALQHTGLKSERVGDYGSSSVDYNKERIGILARLNRKGMMP